MPKENQENLISLYKKRKEKKKRQKGNFTAANPKITITRRFEEDPGPVREGFRLLFNFAARKTIDNEKKDWPVNFIF